jgi:hypothetical protein
VEHPGVVPIRKALLLAGIVGMGLLSCCHTTNTGRSNCGSNVYMRIDGRRGPPLDNCAGVVGFDVPLTIHVGGVISIGGPPRSPFTALRDLRSQDPNTLAPVAASQDGAFRGVHPGTTHLVATTTTCSGSGSEMAECPIAKVTVR